MRSVVVWLSAATTAGDKGGQSRHMSSQRFDMYAINVGPPAPNVYFGSGTVKVS